MGREEALRMACRLEAPHDLLPLARRLVGVFRPVIEVPVLPMLHAKQYFRYCQNSRHLGVWECIV